MLDPHSLTFSQGIGALAVPCAQSDTGAPQHWLLLQRWTILRCRLALLGPLGPGSMAGPHSM